MVLTDIPAAGDVRRCGLALPLGVELRPLQTHSDDRGLFTELFREDWGIEPRPVQWNMVRSAANVMRGVHVHLHHADFLTMASGELILGLSDLRPRSPTFGLAQLMKLNAEDLHAVLIPVGVAHGFYFERPACHLYGVSTTFDGTDELGCRWNDPELGFDWPGAAPLLSERDRVSGSLADLQNRVRQANPAWF